MKNFAHYLKAEIADLEAEMRASKTYRRIEEAKRLLALYEGDEVAQGSTAETAAQPDAEGNAMAEEEAEEEPASSASPSDKDPPGDAFPAEPVMETAVPDATAEASFAADAEAEEESRDMPKATDEARSDAGEPAAPDATLAATNATDAPLPETSAPTDAVPLSPAEDPAPDGPAALVQTDPRLTQDEDAPAHDPPAAPDTETDAPTDPKRGAAEAAETNPTVDDTPPKDSEDIQVEPGRPNAPSLSRWRW